MQCQRRRIFFFYFKGNELNFYPALVQGVECKHPVLATDSRLASARRAGVGAASSSSHFLIRTHSTGTGAFIQRETGSLQTGELGRGPIPNPTPVLGPEWVLLRDQANAVSRGTDRPRPTGTRCFWALPGRADGEHSEHHFLSCDEELSHTQQ